LDNLSLRVGVKTDPIHYRYSFGWLFRLLAEEGIGDVQLGSFTEIYHLPDDFFHWLRREAESYGLSITSLFTSNRELGGFLRDEPGWQDVTLKNYKRIIEIGALLGVSSVGSNAGAVLRDRMESKEQGIRRYLDRMKHLMEYAHRRGVATLCLEPMSSLAEPPTLPQEIEHMLRELDEHHRGHPHKTARFGLCFDVAHGYADPSGVVHWDGLELLETALPYLHEIHLKNTDSLFSETFGFSERERSRGTVRVEKFRDLLLSRRESIPVDELVGYLELDGLKRGRDYSDPLLGEALRASLRYLREVFSTDESKRDHSSGVPSGKQEEISVQIAPSIMCVDLCHLEEEVRKLEALKVDLLHFDLMDAHFTPNMPLGFEMIRQLRALTHLPFDVHLMVENNELFVEKLVAIGVQQVSVHAESAVHLDRILETIQRHGMRAGVALNPATPLTVLDYVTERMDFLMLMAVNPGFAGQKLVPSAIRKIRDTRDFLEARGLNIPIEVDGNVSFSNIPRMVAAGADILVAGTSSLFHSAHTLEQNMEELREAVRKGMKRR
jgi:ribulose-phosphate 3-epimerase